MTAAWTIDTVTFYDAGCFLAVLGCLFLVIAFASWAHERRTEDRA